MNKRLVSSTLLFILFGGFILTGVSFFAAQADTSVTGIIASDTTWTKANSPYNLIGNLLVEEGVTLKIEPGTTVNFNGYYMRINGTLSAIGTNDDKITFTIINPSASIGASAIEFKSSGSSWNDQTNSGSIIKNTVINSKWEYGYGAIRIDSVSPMIVDNVIDCRNDGAVGTAISNLMEYPSIIHNNTIFGQVVTSGGILCNNTIYGKVGAIGGMVCNNTISNPDGFGISLSWNATASGNTVSGCDVGIRATIPPSSSYGVALVQRNLIYNNNYGVQMMIGSTEQPILSAISVENNTILNNNVGVLFSLSSPMDTYQILNNNILNNSNYNFQTSVKSDVNATQNWWGTTNTEEIEQGIYDFKSDFNLGTVAFAPFLTAQNPEAPEIPTSPTPTPTPTPTPNPTPTPTPTATPSPSPIPVPGQNYFFVESNSTVNDLFFNSTSAELSFTVTGEAGTAGYVKITVTKSLLSSAQNVTVYLDGNQLNVDITEDGDAWLLCFTYTHSTHQVLVGLTGYSEVGVESWVWVVSSVFVGVLLAVGVASRCRRKGC